jgi:uncharacterized protein YyaL (SSP411 family)
VVIFAMANHLQNSLSPYLQQHKSNPVDWYPWGEEALARARSENKPIFLSVGYSACHWCHVMERESFSDPRVAEILNQHFVSIKVDREERPDLDHIYMTALQMMTGQGGWPLNIFLTPDLRPYFGGTYFAPDARYGRPPFSEVLLRLADAYQNQQDLVRKNADQLVGLLAQGQFFERREKVDNELFEKVVENVKRSYDPKGGGLGGAPKFFHVDGLRALLQKSVETSDAKLLEMVEHSLQKMALGGVYDQIGGGFHRYSTDAEWQVPHFEKMLYDNALLAVLFLEAFQATRSPFYKTVVTQTLDWALREMKSKSGVFYSAIDADSEHHEGKFYIWTIEELSEFLPADIRRDFFERFGVTIEGNFEGRSILHLQSPLNAEEQARFAPYLEKLLEIRAERTWPLIDRKILTSWNGLLITALAKTGATLDEPRFLRAAEIAAEHLWTQNFRGDRLRHVAFEDAVGEETFLEDYAYFAEALLDLYEATLKEKYLVWAKTLADQMILDFSDESEGGFWSVIPQKDVLVRYKEIFDGALPAPFHLAISVVGRLYDLTKEEKWKAVSDRSIQSILGTALASPGGFHRLALVLDKIQNGKRRIVCDEGGCRLVAAND